MSRGDAIAGLIVLVVVFAAFLWGIVLDIRYRVPK